MSNPTHRSRRDFMKVAGVVSAGVSVGALSMTPAVHAQGSDVIKVGLVGCGNRGMGSLMDSLKAGGPIKIIALGDVDQAKAAKGMEDLNKMEDQKAKIDLSSDRLFTGFDAHKKVTDLVDLVYIASPAGFHPDHYLYAVEKGKHVFVEKPLCVDPEGFRRCMKANKIAEEKGLTVCIGFQRRHEARYLQWVSRIHAGFIGDVISTRMYWNGGGGGASVRPRGANETELEYQIRSWYSFSWLCGDHIVEQHCHNLDVGNWIHGKGDPMAHPVSCVGQGGRQMRKAGNIFDHHYVEYRYADGSVMYSTCRQMPNCWSKVGELITGSKGTGDTDWGAVWLQPTGGERWTQRQNQDTNPYVQEHIDQSNAIQKGERLHDGWHASHASMTAVMGRMATYSGQEIKWDDAVAKGRTLFPYDKALTFATEPPIVVGANGNYEHAVAGPGEYDPFDKV